MNEENRNLPLNNSPKENPNQGEENIWLEIVKTFGMAIVLSFGIRTFIAEARYIPSSSMEPTLQINDRLIIEKITYRFHKPERGDIVVFNPTEELQKQDFKEAFIKRIIGIPGDTVMVRKGEVSVNGNVLKEFYIKEAPNYDFGPVIVPDGEYLVLGDNRNNSFDSHYWGFVPMNKIVGRAYLRFWPFGRIGVIEGDSALAVEK